MTDPYRGRGYRAGQPERYVVRDEYPEEEHDYQSYGRGGAPPPDPGYPERYRGGYQDPYEGHAYETVPPGAGVPRGGRGGGGEYRAPPINPDYGRPANRDYQPPPPRPRDYTDPNYYPQTDRVYRAPPPPPRDYPEPRGFTQNPSYRDTEFGRPRPKEFDNYARDYSADPYYEDPPPPPAGRNRAAPSYERGLYDSEPPRARRAAQHPPVSLPPARNEEYHEFSLPAEGIRKEVLQREITLFLGGDATSRGPLQTENGLVFMYRAYRALTSEQIRDLKAKSARYDPGYPRNPEIMPSRPSRRRADEESPSSGISDPSPLEEKRVEYVYSSAVPGTRAPPREIRAGRTPHEPSYSTSYHESRHERLPPIKASAMRERESDDEMED